MYPSLSVQQLSSVWNLFNADQSHVSKLKPGGQTHGSEMSEVASCIHCYPFIPPCRNSCHVPKWYVQPSWMSQRKADVKWYRLRVVNVFDAMSMEENTTNLTILYFPSLFPSSIQKCLFQRKTSVTSTTYWGEFWRTLAVRPHARPCDMPLLAQGIWLFLDVAEICLNVVKQELDYKLTPHLGRKHLGFHTQVFSDLSGYNEGLIMRDPVTQSNACQAVIIFTTGHTLNMQ